MSFDSACLMGTRALSPSMSAEREQAAKRFPGLPDDHVHVWRVPLDQDSERTALSLEILSPDEREKAARFHFDKDRNRFVQARAALRFILSDYLNVAPGRIEFAYGPQGKPSLANRFRQNGLRFNLSRRGDIALIAVASDREVGVDVELVQADFAVFEVAKASFSPAELAALRSLPLALLAAGFYNCWTRKEAYVKARGEGLSFPLKDFDVSLVPGEPARLLDVRDDGKVNSWTLRDIPVGEGYVAALAVDGTGLNVSWWDWEDRQAPPFHGTAKFDPYPGSSKPNGSRLDTTRL